MANSHVELVDRLRVSLRWHPGVLVGVGSGRASVGHKLNGLVHHLRLTMPSWHYARQLFESVVSFTGNMGTGFRVVLYSALMFWTTMCMGNRLDHT